MRKVVETMRKMLETVRKMLETVRKVVETMRKVAETTRKVVETTMWSFCGMLPFENDNFPNFTSMTKDDPKELSIMQKSSSSSFG